MITLDSFQQSTRRTWNPESSLPNAALGLAGETGELVDIIKKYLYHGHEYNRENVVSELSDVMYYVAVIADWFGITLSEVAEYNIEKLRQRYPDGFSEERSRER